MAAAGIGIGSIRSGRGKTCSGEICSGGIVLHEYNSGKINRGIKKKWNLLMFICSAVFINKCNLNCDQKTEY
jgi:hypothetical protein